MIRYPSNSDSYLLYLEKFFLLIIHIYPQLLGIEYIDFDHPFINSIFINIFTSIHQTY